MSTVSDKTSRRAELKGLEVTIAQWQRGYAEAGLALRKIHDDQLYKAGRWDTFEAYVHERWDWTPGRASQIIGAAEVADEFTKVNLPIPKNERQARELIPVLRQAGREAVVELWREIVRHGIKTLRAKDIHEAVGVRFGYPEDHQMFYTLGPEHAAMGDFAFKGEGHPCITGVYVAQGKAVATNGALLVVVPTGRHPASHFPFPEGEKMKPMQDGAIIPPDKIELALRAAASHSQYSVTGAIEHVFLAQAPDGLVCLCATDLEVYAPIRFRPITGPYPNYEQTIPSKEGRFRVTLSPRYLKKLAALAEKFDDGENPMLNLWFDTGPGGHLKSVRFEVSVPEKGTMYGALAPMRTPADYGAAPQGPEKPATPATVVDQTSAPDAAAPDPQPVAEEPAATDTPGSETKLGDAELEDLLIQMKLKENPEQETPPEDG